MSLIPARSILGGDGPRLTGREFVLSNVVGKFLFVSFADRRVFIITVGLAGDDLPFAVAPQPGVGDVVTRLQVLTEDGFGFVGVVTQHRRVANDPADDVVDLAGAGISFR